MSSGNAHGDGAAIKVMPQRQARAEACGNEFPPDLVTTPVVLKHSGSVSLHHLCFGHLRRARSHRGSNRLGIKGRPLPQRRRVGQRLSNCFRRVAQFSDENEHPLLSVLSGLRPAGWTRCILRDRSSSSPSLLARWN